MTEKSRVRVPDKSALTVPHPPQYTTRRVPDVNRTLTERRESFNEADSTTIGPDLAWEKLDTQGTTNGFITGSPSGPGFIVGSNDGEVLSGGFTVYGGSGAYVSLVAPYDLLGSSFIRTVDEVTSDEMYTEVGIGSIGPFNGTTENASDWHLALGVGLGSDSADWSTTTDTLGLIKWDGIYAVFSGTNFSIESLNIYQVYKPVLGTFVVNLYSQLTSHYCVNGDVFGLYLRSTGGGYSVLDVSINGTRIVTGTGPEGFALGRRTGMGLRVRSISGTDVRTRVRLDNFSFGEI